MVEEVFVIIQKTTNLSTQSAVNFELICITDDYQHAKAMVEKRYNDLKRAFARSHITLESCDFCGFHGSIKYSVGNETYLIELDTRSYSSASEVVKINNSLSSYSKKEIAEELIKRVEERKEA